MPRSRSSARTTPLPAMQRNDAAKIPPIAAAKRPDLLGMLFLPVLRRFARTQTVRVLPPAPQSMTNAIRYSTFSKNVDCERAYVSYPLRPQEDGHRHWPDGRRLLLLGGTIG